MANTREGSLAGFDDDDNLSLKQLVAVFKSRVLLPWYLIIVVNMFLVGILFGFLPVYIYTLHHSQLANGLIIGACTLSYLLVQPFTGRLADRGRPRTVMLIGLTMSAAGVLVIPFTSGVTLVLAAICGGLGVGVVWTSTDAMVSKLADPRRLAATMGVAGSFKEFGDMLGPLLIGGLAQALSLEASFIICGVLGILSIGLLRLARDPVPGSS